jgi:photosystem II stability/assembly factor-like uncharacterized protein
MKFLKLFLWIVLPSFLLSGSYNSSAQQGNVPSKKYTWKSVRMVGGGFVDGIVFHPTAKNVCYCRTDIGGAYRRNPETMVWEPLLDWLSYEDMNLMGVESIALDPTDPNKVYLSCGTYTNDRTPNGAILCSSDKGKTFTRVDVPFKMGGNENGRGNGERMAVDPNDGRILYLGTRLAGLWRSLDSGASWQKVESFPDIAEVQPAAAQNAPGGARMPRMSQGSGVIFAIFDPKSGTKGKASQTIYVGVSLMDRDNMFVSNDGGLTWKAIAGQPTQCRPTHAILTPDGFLYVTYGTNPGPNAMRDGGVWKYDKKSGKWTDITPDKPEPDNNKAFGYAAVSVDSKNPKVVIVSSFGRPGNAGGEDIFKSNDGGQIWKPVIKSGGVYDWSKAPYTQHTGIHWLFDIEIDPSNSDHVMFTTGYSGYETFNFTDVDKGKPTKWEVMGTGVEETVALELLSPPKGAHLISAIGDYAGFVHWDLDKPAPEGNFSNPRFGNTNGVDYAWNKPEVIVRVGRSTNNNPNQNIGYSFDGGKSWQPAKSQPQPSGSLGFIAVSADAKTWIWAPQSMGFGRMRQPDTAQAPASVYWTSDMGETWHACQGLAANTRVVASRVNPDKFYAIDLFNGKLFASADAGKSFLEKPLALPNGLPQRGSRGDSRGGQDRIYTTPGYENDLWIAAFDGLYRSTDEGASFARTGKVSEIHGFGFGKEAPGKKYPALYLIGVVDGVRGMFRSNDEGLNWTRINDDQHQWGLVLHITGDPKKYGRVYVGTHGRGTVYGDPAL